MVNKMKTLNDMVREMVDQYSQTLIARLLRVDQKTVSNYYNGATVKKKTEVEELYKKFLGGEDLQSKPVLNKNGDYTEKYIKLLEEQNERMTNLILNDLANIKASLEQLSESQAGIALVSHQARDFAIEVLSKSLKVPSEKMKQDADKELASSAEGIVKKGR